MDILWYIFSVKVIYKYGLEAYYYHSYLYLPNVNNFLLVKLQHIFIKFPVRNNSDKILMYTGTCFHQYFCYF